MQFNNQKDSWMSQFASVMLYSVRDDHSSTTLDLPLEFVKFMIGNIWRGDGTCDEVRDAILWQVLTSGKARFSASRSYREQRLHRAVVSSSDGDCQQFS